MSRSPFLQSISRGMRQKGYSLRTGKTYFHWIKRFILFHNKRHPNTMDGAEVRIFVSYLANVLMYLPIHKSCSKMCVDIQFLATCAVITYTTLYCVKRLNGPQ